MNADQAGTVGTNQDQLGDGEVIHIVNAVRGWFGDLLGRVPVAMCGASLLAEDDDPDPAEQPMPICLDCVDAYRSIERNEAGERVKARLSRLVERFGLAPIRPAGTCQDLSDYAAEFARLYRECELAQEGLDRIADQCEMTGPERAAFYRRHPMNRALARHAARAAGRLSWWQERSIRACYPPIRPRTKSVTP